MLRTRAVARRGKACRRALSGEAPTERTVEIKVPRAVGRALGVPGAAAPRRRQAAVSERLAFGGPFPYKVDRGTFQDGLDTYLAGGGRLMEVEAAHAEWCEAIHTLDAEGRPIETPDFAELTPSRPIGEYQDTPDPALEEQAQEAAAETGAAQAEDEALAAAGEPRETPVRVVATVRLGEDPARHVASLMSALRVPRIDTLLLEVPRGADAAAVPDALRAMQGEVERGAVSALGLHSEAFGLPAEHPQHVAVEPLLDAAPESLAAVRFPASLLSAGPLWRRNCAGGTATVAEVARGRGLAVWSTSPLDGFWNDGSLHRLQSYPSAADGQRLSTKLKEALDNTAHIELKYRELHTKLAGEGVTVPRVQDVAWSQIFAANLEYVLNWSQWEDAYHKQLRPAMRHIVETLRNVRDALGWVTAYRVGMEVTMRRISEAAQHNSSCRSDDVLEMVNRELPALEADRPEVQSLEAQAVATLMAAGVDAVFTHPHVRGRAYGNLYMMRTEGSSVEPEPEPVGRHDKRELLNVIAGVEPLVPHVARADAVGLLQKAEQAFGVDPMNPPRNPYHDPEARAQAQAQARADTERLAREEAEKKAAAAQEEAERRAAAEAAGVDPDVSAKK